ncbi:MAG: nicotinate-nucleotide adenylyltransferase [Gammaproteobacteria bacterium]|nr:nicotinate-nucleotide adenylyltransferase [Gammaproteobacteria bacterium]
MIAILGGSFDPVHIGHLRVAIEVRDHFQLEQVRLIPCGNPPHRESMIATSEQRLRMLELAVGEEQGLLVDDRELRQGRISYTVDTLIDLRREFSDQAIALIIGADAYQHLNSWYHWQQLFELAHVIVVCRPGYRITANSNVTEFVSTRITQQAAQLQQSLAGMVYFMEIPALDISSSRIRQLIADRKSYRYLVTQAVHDWIQLHQIY